MVNFADQATTADAATAVGDPTSAQSGQPLGVALAKAKAQYYGAAASFDAYDAKCVMQTTLYGMPQYRLNCTTHGGTQTTRASSSKSMVATSLDDAGKTLDAASVRTMVGEGTTSGENREPLLVNGDQVWFSLNIKDQGVTTEYGRYPLYDRTTLDGSHIIEVGVQADFDPSTLIYQSESTYDRPTQPKVVETLPAGRYLVKSAIVTAGSYFERGTTRIPLTPRSAPGPTESRSSLRPRSLPTAGGRCLQSS